VLAVWSAARPGQPVADIYQNVGSGETAYDASLRDLTRTHGALRAHLVADALFYSAAAADFSEANVLPNEVAVAVLLGLMGALIVVAARHPALRRRGRLQQSLAAI